MSVYVCVYVCVCVLCVCVCACMRVHINVCVCVSAQQHQQLGKGKPRNLSCTEQLPRTLANCVSRLLGSLLVVMSTLGSASPANAYSSSTCVRCTCVGAACGGRRQGREEGQEERALCRTPSVLA